MWLLVSTGQNLVNVVKECPLIWNLSKRIQSALKNFTIYEESSEAEELSSMETMALLNSDPTEALEFISDAIDDRSTGGTEAKSSEAVGFVFLSGIFGLEGEFTASINGSETVIAPEANAGEGEAITKKIDISDNAMLLFLISVSTGSKDSTLFFSTFYLEL